ncbi:MAG TPA: hypothetical protein VJP77_06625, partial [Planctomycetota bacterium]|nr:hypothetical protein [Planctomycetota bacterium]
MVVVPGQILAALLGIALAIAVGALLVFGVFKLFQGVVWLVGTGFRGVAALVTHVGRELFGIVRDTLRSAGATLTAFVFAPLVVGNVALGRWSTAGHYGRALTQELENAAVGLYRAGVGHPLRLVGLGALVEGFEE